MGAGMVDVGARKAECPNCGGPIELRLGASRALVCPWCRHSVVASDLALEDLGEVAELAPTAARFAVGDSGQVAGEPFVVGGRLQLDHGAGPWDEWYVQLGEGSRRWGWLAAAQGRYYLTEPVEVQGEVPPYERMEPDATGTLPGLGDTRWTVAEQGASTLVSAEGELPEPARPGERGLYVDLVAPGDKFATVDYGDGTEPAKIYAGVQLAPHEVVLGREAVGPRPEQAVKAEALRCPTCGAPAPVRTPATTERVVCASCHSVLDYTAGQLRFVQKLEQTRARALIPLGTQGTLRGERATCIGFMERFTRVDGETYAWGEYLFDAPGGYRWLLEDSGHFTWYRDVSAAAVKQTSARRYAFEGRSYRAFSVGDAEVRFVAGEFYWKVRVGDRTKTLDAIHPPFLLSEESSEHERNWSHGQYVPGAEVWKAFALEGRPPRPEGVAPAQPNRLPVKQMFMVGAGLFILLTLFALWFDFTGKREVLSPMALPLPNAPLGQPPSTPPPADEVAKTRTPAFSVMRAGALAVDLQMKAEHAWVGARVDLLDAGSSKHIAGPYMVEAARYGSDVRGTRTSDGWTRGQGILPGVRPGTYVLEVASSWQPYPAQPTQPMPQAELSVYRTGRGACMYCCALVLIALPLFGVLISYAGFEARRRINSTF